MLVNLFATWCLPRRMEHPELIRFHQRHRAVGDLEVVGVVYADTAEAVRDFRSDEGGDRPVLPDPGGRVALDLAVARVPESFLVNPGGVVVPKILVGVRAGDLEQLLQRAKAEEITEGNMSWVSSSTCSVPWAARR